MLATTSNQLLAGSQPSSPGASPKHDQSPRGAPAVPPLAAASDKSLKRLNEDLVESGGNLVMNVHPLELIESEQPDQATDHHDKPAPQRQQPEENGQIVIKSSNLEDD